MLVLLHRGFDGLSERTALHLSADGDLRGAANRQLIWGTAAVTLTHSGRQPVRQSGHALAHILVAGSHTRRKLRCRDVNSRHSCDPGHSLSAAKQPTASLHPSWSGSRQTEHDQLVRHLSGARLE